MATSHSEGQEWHVWQTVGALCAWWQPMQLAMEVTPVVSAIALDSATCP